MTTIIYVKNETLMKLYSGLKGNPELLKQYDDIVTAQKELGIVEEVKDFFMLSAV